jgi:hypothetical protein
MLTIAVCRTVDKNPGFPNLVLDGLRRVLTRSDR